MAVDWNGIQQRFAQEAQAVGQQQAQAQPQQQYDDTPIGRALGRASQEDPSRLVDLGGFLTQGANNQYDSQKAMLGQARDQQVAEMEKAYGDAVEAGNMSVREAEKALKEQLDAIHKEAYNDSERTAVVAEDRGISNSQQMMGMVAGDNARKQSLINNVMTERDKRVSDVKDRINNLLTKKNLDVSNANSMYNYGLANQRGQIGSQLAQQMFGMGYDDYNKRQDRMHQIGTLGLQDELQRGQMGIQQGFDLEKMAQNFGYDISKMNLQQQQQLAQMAQGFGYDSALQNDSQSFQAGQNEIERSFKMQQFQAEQKAVADNYELELAREMASYDPNTPEGKLRKAQLESSYQAVQLESQAKLMSDVMGKQFADLVGNPPSHPGKKASNKEIDKYNKQIESYNEKLNSYMENPTNMSTFITNLQKEDYNKPGSGVNPITGMWEKMFNTFDKNFGGTATP